MKNRRIEMKITQKLIIIMIIKFIKYFKAKSLNHLILIFIIFGISGSLTLILSEPIINFIKMNEILENTFILLLLRIIIIFPLYQLVLISIATIFGEFNYFLSFERICSKNF